MSVGYINDTTNEGPDHSPLQVRVHEDEGDGKRVFYDATVTARVNRAWISTELTIALSEVR